MRLRHIVLGISLLALLFTGCFMSHMTTARPVGAGKVALTPSVGYVPTDGAIEDSPHDPHGYANSTQLQSRLDIGLSNSVDLGFTTGIGASIHTYWLGAIVEVKYAFVNDPDSVTIAAGASVGRTLKRTTIGGSLYIDSNIPFFPLHISIRPECAMGNAKDVDTNDDGYTDTVESITVFFLDFAVGFHFDLSDSVRLLIEGTSFNAMSGDDQSFFKLWNFGAGVQFLL